MRIDRAEVLSQVWRAIRANPVTVLYGPRQCGKTTLAREIAATPQAEYFDLDDPVSERRLSEPMLALRALRGLVVIEEVQRRPDLFPSLRVLADRQPLPARFLILGSASPELLRQGSESLAGRVALIEMGGFNISETSRDVQRKLWWRGGFPRAFLARTERESRAWQENFIRTFLERDIQELGVRIPPAALRRFGPSRYAKTLSSMVAANSPALPPVRVSSCSSSAFDVFFTPADMASRSSGTGVRRSTTSTDALRGQVARPPRWHSIPSSLR